LIWLHRKSLEEQVFEEAVRIPIFHALIRMFRITTLFGSL